MASGKTTIGRGLAALLKREFVDSDDLVEKKAGMPIHEIFRTRGEAAFREMEQEALKELSEEKKPMVVALGGGAVCNGKSLDLVKKSGLLIYLRIPLITLAERLETGTKQRPLLAGLTGEQLLDSIEQRMTEREKYYSEAHLTVNGINLTASHLYRIIQSGRLQGNI